MMPFRFIPVLHRVTHMLVHVKGLVLEVKKVMVHTIRNSSLPQKALPLKRLVSSPAFYFLDFSTSHLKL